MNFLIPFASFCLILGLTTACDPTLTTVSGTKAPEIVCAGELIFEDTFDSLDRTKWRHDNTLGGGGNWEVRSVAKI